MWDCKEHRSCAASLKQAHFNQAAVEAKQRSAFTAAFNESQRNMSLKTPRLEQTNPVRGESLKSICSSLTPSSCNVVHPWTIAGFGKHRPRVVPGCACICKCTCKCTCSLTIGRDTPGCVYVCTCACISALVPSIKQAAYKLGFITAVTDVGSAELVVLKKNFIGFCKKNSKY